MECCNYKTKKRTEEEKKALVNRLSRIEGQVRGVRSMVDDDAYCVDILTQVSAISAALAAFNRELLFMHIDGCVRDDILAGGEKKVSELSDLLKKLIK